MARSPLDSARRLLPFGLAFAVGLGIAGYASATYATFAYMRANPAVGAVSTSTGFELFTLVAFLAGVVLAFVSAGAALSLIREETA